jgi:uncharacterized protein (TIGR02271 family)
MKKANRGRRQRSPESSEVASVPVVRESITVDKRLRETGQVVVHIEPQVKREVVDMSLAGQEVQVERVPVNRPVESASSPRQEGDTTIVPVYEEVLVIEKRLMLKEEIRITRRQRHHQEKREVEVRTEEAHILRAENNPR